MGLGGRRCEQETGRPAFEALFGSLTENVMGDRVAEDRSQPQLARLFVQRHLHPVEQVMVLMFGQHHRFAAFRQRPQIGPFQRAMPHHLAFGMKRNDRNQFPGLVELYQSLRMVNLGMDVARTIDAIGQLGNRLRIDRRQSADRIVCWRAFVHCGLSRYTWALRR